MRLDNEGKKMTLWSAFSHISVSQFAQRMSMFGYLIFFLFLCRYDLDCKSDNLSRHVSVSFTSAVQQSVMHSFQFYTATVNLPEQ